MITANRIDRFLADPKVQRLLHAERETRPLTICFPREPDISRFLAWFLDPSQGHGLQDAPIRSLLTAAWRNCDDARVDNRIKQLISPTATVTRSFTGCLIQREVRLLTEKKSKGGQLDLLILDSKLKLLIAVENKFGANEGDSQLEKYRAALAKQFKDWKRVCIFLDVNDESPKDPYWIGLNCEWLVEELAAAETSPWLGVESKAALQQFKAAIDINGDASASNHERETLLLEVVEAHREVIEQMANWRRARGGLSAIVKADFWSATTICQRALKQLFHVYWQRSELWGESIQMLSYAPILNAVRKAFPDVQQDPKRKAFFYWLPYWEGFEREDAKVHPLQVVVRFLPTAEEGDDSGPISNRLKIVSKLDTRYVKSDQLDALREVAKAMRSKYLKSNRQLRDEPGRITLRVDMTENEADVTGTLIEHLKVLDLAFRQAL